MNAVDISRLLAVAKEELLALRGALAEKGFKHFSRPLGLGAIMAFASYYFIYTYSISALASVDRELKDIQATIKYKDTYQDLCAKLTRLYVRLPKGKDPEAWLLSEIRESLRQEKIEVGSFSPPSETMADGYKFVSISVRCEASYRQLANWIARVERGASLMYIKNLSLGKKTKPIGMNSADITVTTVVPEAQTQSLCASRPEP